MNDQFKYHPFIEGLKVNQDGSVILIKGERLTPFVNGSSSTPRVNFNSKSHSVIKLICEAWNGPRENTAQRVIHIDGKKENNHYSNLTWGMSTTQKLSRTDLEEIRQSIKTGVKKIDLARKYNVSSTHIARIAKEL